MKQVIYILIILISFSSCTALKKVVKKKEHISLTSEKSLSVADSIISVWNNREIVDKFTFKIPKSNTADKRKDSLIDARLDEILSKINFKKSSGSNSYRMRYNPNKREIVTNVTVGETTDSNSSVVKLKTYSKTETDIITSFSKKTGIPKLYLIIGLVFLLRKQIIWLIGLFYPPFKSFKVIKFLK